MATTEKRLSVNLDATTRTWLQHRAKMEDRSESYIAARILSAARDEHVLEERAQAAYQAKLGPTEERKVFEGMQRGDIATNEPEFPSADKIKNAKKIVDLTAKLHASAIARNSNTHR